VSRSNGDFSEQTNPPDPGFPMEIMLIVDRSRRGVRQQLQAPGLASG
jgi:hypothetical protein